MSDPTVNGNESETESIDEKRRTCKICYGCDDDMPNYEWSTPCKCSGSIKYVHRQCLERWLINAPASQQSACNTCRFPYRRCWELKPLEKWSIPRLNLSVWQVVEIVLDFYSTLRLVRNTIAMFQGRKSVFGQFCYAIFWKTFIFSSARCDYYRGLCRSLLNSFFESNIMDAVDEN
ncbi:RING-CH-type domain-containing protein [Aphelenchoides besseyi]|nr:RING-CH-type domain-containing protein [Aphelenchoides besseyi]KAI6194532.1 RING-CH-type domain-containing protein [Aphelenchoides besseyi]